MSKPQRGGEPLELLGGPLGDLAFHWSGDRYVHEWHFREAVTPLALMSVESGHDVAWPVSPPLQQIHRQSFADGREVVFGVGMAGRGHWSASFTLVPDLKCWIVELACRASVAPETLMSTYRLAGEWYAASDHEFRCESGKLPLLIESIAVSSAAELAGDHLRIRPSQLATSAATQQWAFRLRADKA